MSNLIYLKNKPLKKNRGNYQYPASVDKSKPIPPDKILKESEIRYLRLFESAKDGILILDFETGNIIEANPFIVKIIDHPLDEIIGKQLWEIGLFRNKEQSELALIELKTKGYIRFDDMPIQRQNGKLIEVEFVSNVYWENNTKVIQCNIRDITERKHAELVIQESEQKLKIQNDEYLILNNEYTNLNEELSESLNRIQKINDELIISKNKAEESDRLKSAFLTNMSHEIRTPMNAIVGFAGFLLEPELSRDKIENFVQIINASSQQLLSVISDVMDSAKIDSGQISIDYELVNINNLLNELLVTYKKIVELKKISLQCSFDPNDVIEINTDGNRIKQVICNLLNNAIKFTKEGKIEFGYGIQDNFLAFYVKDTGIGIAPENQALVFERFRQVETTNNQIYGGNGLGLSISKALIEKLGGTITVNSELGLGSTFTFTIPYIKKIENTVSPEQIVESGPFINWKEKTILIVEDDKFNHTYIEELLLPTHAMMIHAWDGREAVEQVKNHPDVSLVLMDVKMPIMNGYEATRLIKQIRPKLPVIVQTAYALSQDREQALKAGCDAYLSKPLNRELLMGIMNNYLSQ